jgi:hypothetical protein
MPHRVSQIERRRVQILKQLDHLRRQMATKSPKDYKAPYHYENSRRTWEQLSYLLEKELSVMHDPGEYELLPAAVVADELGVTIDRVRALIGGGEIAADGKSGHERISREELERLAALGLKELERQSEQEAAEIFALACRALREGDIEQGEKEYKRLEAREFCIGSHAFALEIALALLKNEYSEIDSNLAFLNRRGHIERAAFLGNIGLALKDLTFTEHSAQVIAERLINLSEGKGCDGGLDDFGSRGRQHGKRLDELQHRAMYVTTVLLNAIEKAKLKNFFSGRSPKLEPLLRNAVYTALSAEATYAESATSRMFVDSTKAQVPRYFEPAKLIDL